MYVAEKQRDVRSFIIGPRSALVDLLPYQCLFN